MNGMKEKGQTLLKFRATLYKQARHRGGVATNAAT
jgi:hypothetical protein